MAVFRSRVLLALSIAVGILGCQRDPSNAPNAALSSADTARAAAAIAQPAWLRDRLPAHTVGYARIPTLWGLMSAPSGRALDPALASEAHTRLIGQLRDAIGKDKLIVDSGYAPFMLLAFDDLAAPLEMAIVDAGDMANPTSSVFVTVPLKLADVAQVNARIAALSAGTPWLKAPLGADGKGEAQGNGFLQFDVATHRLHGLFGMTASASGLNDVIAQLATMREHPVQAIERGIDRSGQGLFFWMSLKGVNSMAAAQLPSATAGSLGRDFIDNSQNIALGWGTVDQRGKLQLQIHSPQARLLSYFAPGEFHAAVKTAGKPDWALTMALPTAAQWSNLETHLDQDFGAGTSASYRKGMDLLREKAGVEVKDILGLMGPELIAFEDQAGSYSALRVADRSALYAKLDEVGQRLGWKRETIKLGSLSVQHLAVPGIGAAAKADDAPQLAWLQLYGRVGNHLYWVEEGDYLVFGQVPQALADRAAAKPETSLADWLKSQSYDPAATLFGVTGTTRNVQRKVYYAYLGGLQAFGDLLSVPVNLADLPPASQLDLPVNGAAGFALDATRERIGFSLTYEQTPAEFLLAGGGTTMVATTAILAAIAVPAYQDYTLRAEATQVVAALLPLQQAIADYYASRGKLPDSDEDLDLPAIGDAEKYLSNYYVEDGALVVTFGDQADSKLADGVLVIKPLLTAGKLTWQCGYAAIPDGAQSPSSVEAETTLAAKYLPSSCR